MPVWDMVLTLLGTALFALAIGVCVCLGAWIREWMR